MKVSYGLPSATYNIVLSKDDLVKLIDTGRINVFARDLPCTTSRAVYNREKRELETLDRKEVTNNLRFRLEDDVADIHEGEYSVQFLAIRLEVKNDV